MVPTDDECALFGDGQESLELGLHRRFATVHRHLVKAADKPHLRVRRADRCHVDARLS